MCSSRSLVYLLKLEWRCHDAVELYLEINRAVLWVQALLLFVWFIDWFSLNIKFQVYKMRLTITYPICATQLVLTFWLWWWICCFCYVTSVVSDSVQPHRRQPTRLPRPWDSPGKSTGVGCHFLLQCMKVKSESEVAQSCPTLSNPMDCSLPGSSVHGIFQARVLE